MKAILILHTSSHIWKFYSGQNAKLHTWMWSATLAPRNYIYDFSNSEPCNLYGCGLLPYMKFIFRLFIFFVHKTVFSFRWIDICLFWTFASLVCGMGFLIWSGCTVTYCWWLLYHKTSYLYITILSLHERQLLGFTSSLNGITGQIYKQQLKILAIIPTFYLSIGRKYDVVNKLHFQPYRFYLGEFFLN